MDDQEILGLIECFRNRLRKLIIVEPLMDLIHFLEDDDKEMIRVKLSTQGNFCAVDHLLETITKRVRPQGWFKEFIDALEKVGCGHAVSYIMSPPTPSWEAENDCCIKLIDLLQFNLVRMKTRDVCVSCYTLDILTEEDCDNIFTEIEKKGNISGARLLLRRVVRNEAGWFSTFLRALQNTGHPDLVKELLGEDLVDHEQKSNEGDPPCGQTDAENPETEASNAQSEGSDIGLALKSSTHSIAGLLCDYIDDEIDLYTDPYEQVGQASGNENKDVCPSDASIKDQITTPPADGSVLQPVESHNVHAGDTHSVDNPIESQLQSSSSSAAGAAQATFTGLLDGGGPEGGIIYGWDDDDYEPADGNTWDDWDDYSPGDGAGSYWSDYEGLDDGDLYDSI